MISQATTEPLEGLPWLEPELADRLEVARLRFRGLSALLSPLAWRTRLTASLELLREIRRALPEADRTLGHLFDRIALEPREVGVDRLRRHLSAVAEARARLHQRAARRLDRPAQTPLAVLLKGLEEAVLEVSAPPRDDQEAWSIARRLLPRNLTELLAATRCAQLLLPFASRGSALPALASQPPPPSLEETLRIHAEAQVHLEALRLHLLRADLSGRVIEVVWRAGRAAPREQATHGAAELAAALFWTELAGTRLADLAGQLVAPLRLRDREVAPILTAWVAAGGRRLPEVDLPETSGARTALIQLALATATAPNAFVAPLPTSQLMAWAGAAAELGPEDVDLQALTLSLRAALLRVGEGPPGGGMLPSLVSAWIHHGR